MKYISHTICTAIIILSCFFVPVMAAASGSSGGYGGGGSSGDMVFTSSASQAVAIPIPITPAGYGGDIPAGNFSRLSISPQNLQFRLGPGESDEQTFSVTNKGKDTVLIRPRATEMPYAGPNVMDSTWVSFSPSEISVAPGEKAKFSVKVMIPSDTSRGYYAAQLALTDEQYPSPYPVPYSSYVYQVSISTEVYTPPVLSISPYMLGDSLEAGKSYDYEVTLKNSGDHAIKISPKLENNMYYTPMPYGGSENSMLPDDAITLSAPGEIPSGGEASLKVHVNVPADSGGYYNGAVYLGIDDPAVQNGEGMVQLSFMVWKQPAEPFSRSFTMTDSGLLTIELVASKDMSGGIALTTNNAKPAAEPSFDLSIKGPDGKVIPNLTKTVIKGSVDLSGQGQYTTGSKGAPYQESGVQYVSTYSLPGKAGLWNLEIMPHNMGRFDYTITMGPLGDLTIKPSIASTTAMIPAPVQNLSPVGTPSAILDLNQTTSPLNRNQLNSSENQNQSDSILNKSG